MEAFFTPSGKGNENESNQKITGKSINMILSCDSFVSRSDKHTSNEIGHGINPRESCNL